MRLPTTITIGGVGALERHIQVTENVGSQVLETMLRMMWILLARTTVYNQLMVRVDGIVQLDDNVSGLSEIII